jgi:hypothetical protein
LNFELKRILLTALKGNNSCSQKYVNGLFPHGIVIILDKYNTQIKTLNLFVIYCVYRWWARMCEPNGKKFVVLSIEIATEGINFPVIGEITCIKKV